MGWESGKGTYHVISLRQTGEGKPMKAVAVFLASVLATVAIASGITMAAASPAVLIPLWHDGNLVTGLLLRGAEPGQPGFIPLPAAQAGSSNDIIYVIQNNPNQMGAHEVITHIPGERGYTGGRWTVVFVAFNNMLAPAARPNVVSASQVLALAAAEAVDLVFPGVYFECPVVSSTLTG